MTAEPEVRCERVGALGLIELNRPAALNALTHEMVVAISRGLTAWRDDPRVAAVLVRATPGRAFCAGGDIRAVTMLAREAGIAAAIRFFAHEYRLNWRIKHFPKPYLALLDGVTMGGGVGISVHGTYRVATEATLLAMPETAIGFFPDVGATWFLPRLSGAAGSFLGLTGARLGPGDCMDLGIATHFLPRERLNSLEERLSSGDAPAAALAALAAPPPAGSLRVHRDDIDAHFAGRRLADVLASLQASGRPWALVQVRALAAKSPFALAVTDAQLRRGAGLATFAEAMRLEYRMAHRFLAHPDFAEGVRAMVLDKDRAPRWAQRSPADVSADAVEAVFAPLADGDLALDWQGI